MKKLANTIKVAAGEDMCRQDKSATEDVPNILPVVPDRLSDSANNARVTSRGIHEAVAGANPAVNVVNDGIYQSNPRDAMSWQADERRHGWFRRQILPLEHKLRAYLRRLTHSNFDVDDSVQDAFTTILVYENWASVKTPQAFVITIARNLVFDELRRQKMVSILFLSDVEVLGHG